MNKIRVDRVIQRPAGSSVFARHMGFFDLRKKIREKLGSLGVLTTVYYPVPLMEQPTQNHLCCSDCTPIPNQTARRVMSLPMITDLTVEDQEKVVSALLS